MTTNTTLNAPTAREKSRHARSADEAWATLTNVDADTKARVRGLLRSADKSPNLIAMGMVDVPGGPPTDFEFGLIEALRGTPPAGGSDAVAGVPTVAGEIMLKAVNA